MIINRRTWRKRKLEICFGGVVLVAAIFSHQDIKRNMDTLSNDRLRIANNAAEQRRLEENTELLQAKAVIAEGRYKDGCTLVVAANSPRNLATLVEGETVLDRVTSKPLPTGTVVCDANGSTGVLTPNAEGVPVVADMAFTGKRELALDQLRKIKGARVYYTTPGK